MIVSRRGFIGGLAGLLAAPAIVRATSLMPVKVFRRPLLDLPENRWVGYGGTFNVPDLIFQNRVWRVTGPQEISVSRILLPDELKEFADA
jgi:hypothetical protein